MSRAGATRPEPGRRQTAAGDGARGAAREALLLLGAALLAAAAAWYAGSPRLPLRADPSVYLLNLDAPVLEPEIALQLYRTGGCLVVDTRPGSNPQDEYIPGAFFIRPGSFDNDLLAVHDFLTPADHLLLYGNGDLAELGAIAARFRERGYDGVSLLRGGLEAWRRAGGELVGQGAAAVEDHDG